MSDDIDSFDATNPEAIIKHLVAGIMETQAMIFGTFVGAAVHEGLWTEEEAVYRLIELHGRSQHWMAKTTIKGILDAIEKGQGPFLKVIEGGKQD